MSFKPNKGKSRWMIVDVEYTLLVLDAITENGGQVFAINPNVPVQGKAPRTREIWFYCDRTSAEIATLAGLDAVQEAISALYQAGYDAHDAGESLRAYPRDIDPEEQEIWRDGWKAAALSKEQENINLYRTDALVNHVLRKQGL